MYIIMQSHESVKRKNINNGARARTAALTVTGAGAAIKRAAGKLRL